jgi:hypothetical protein
MYTVQCPILRLHYISLHCQCAYYTSCHVVTYHIVSYDMIAWTPNKDWFLQGTAFQLSAPRAWHTNYNKPGQCSTPFAKIFDWHKDVEHHRSGHYIYLHNIILDESVVLCWIYLADGFGHVPASFCLSCYLEWWSRTNTRLFRVWLNN